MLCRSTGAVMQEEGASLLLYPSPSVSSSPCKQAQSVCPIKASNDRDVQEAARDLKIGEGPGKLAVYCRAPWSAYLRALHLLLRYSMSQHEQSHSLRPVLLLWLTFLNEGSLYPEGSLKMMFEVFGLFTCNPPALKKRVYIWIKVRGPDITYCSNQHVNVINSFISPAQAAWTSDWSVSWDVLNPSKVTVHLYQGCRLTDSRTDREHDRRT